MAHCEICGKSRVSGNHVSHANNRVKRQIHPNIQSKKMTAGGVTKRMNVCTRCLRTGNYK